MQFRIRGHAFLYGPSNNDKFPAKRLSPPLSDSEPSKKSFSWEDERVRIYHKHSPVLKASFLRPTPGTAMKTVDAKLEDFPEELKEGQEEEMKKALERFALIAIDPWQIDAYVSSSVQSTISHDDAERIWAVRQTDESSTPRRTMHGQKRKSLLEHRSLCPLSFGSRCSDFSFACWCDLFNWLFILILCGCCPFENVSYGQMRRAYQVGNLQSRLFDLLQNPRLLLRLRPSGPIDALSESLDA